MKMIIDLPDDYPNQVPNIRIKNLCQDIIDNNLMIQFESMVMTKAEESIGTQMIYDVCEHLRERLADMNEKILNKLQEIEDSQSVEKALKTLSVSQDAPMNFTPVNADTFARWLSEYKEKQRKIKEEMKSDLDLKPTGRELFQMKNKVIEEINIDEDDEGGEEFKQEDGEDEEEEDFVYDKALYVADDQDEDVDFD